MNSLWSEMEAAGLERAGLFAPRCRLALSRLEKESAIRGGVQDLYGRSVLLLTKSQICAALSLIELDGVVGRLVICPPDFDSQTLQRVFSLASIDAIVSDQDLSGFSLPADLSLRRCAAELEPRGAISARESATEWILFTSGTTGSPKLVQHSFAALTGAIKRGPAAHPRPVWATFYDMRRYGGLQMFLRAMLGGCPFFFSEADEPVADHLERLREGGVTHISGTPSHWRRVMLSKGPKAIAPGYVRLSGEIADQGVLDGLAALYPGAKITHAFASTEAGVGFEVTDGLEGFPQSFDGQKIGDAEIKVEGARLLIRSKRAASHFLTDDGKRPLALEDGFVDTGDLVALRRERYHFTGRKDGVINVAGFKVHPEEVEAIINRHPSVAVSLVKGHKNPITGSLVTAYALLKDGVPGDPAGRKLLEREIRSLCALKLAPHKIPALIRFVDALRMTEGGKLARDET